MPLKMNNKLLIAGVIVSSALLGGCVSKADLDASVANTNSQISALSAKVDGLADDHSRIQSDIDANAMEAARANMRIDNIVESYKK